VMAVDSGLSDEPYLVGNIRAGLYLTLEVRDDGCGMDDNTRARMFDPFFSTKFLGRGLGLPAVLGIVRRHEGFIKVNSGMGTGTAILVGFPAIGDNGA
jgi:signal transduction histidine kinase